MRDARPFSEPVDPKQVTDYYSIIQFPMDLKSMETRLNRGDYHDKQLFIEDFEVFIFVAGEFNEADYFKLQNV